MGQGLKMFCFDLKHRISQKYQQRWIYFSVSSMQEILQTLQVVQSPSSSLLLSSFNDLAKYRLLHCRHGPDCWSSRWFYSLTLSSSSRPSLFPNFSTLFRCKRFMSVSFIETFALFRETVLGSFRKISLWFNEW